uniref:Uncharacterized protein n=1 Tax=Trichogramma kaykai TaxID=54128 RepID=A0ABD2WMK0_9HYME
MYSNERKIFDNGLAHCVILAGSNLTANARFHFSIRVRATTVMRQQSLIKNSNDISPRQRAQCLEPGTSGNPNAYVYLRRNLSMGEKN